MDAIRVRVADPTSSTVALWERHPAHPGGEVWLIGAGEFDVAATPAVEARLRDGRLIPVEPAAAPAPAVESAPPPGAGVQPAEEPGEETSVVTRVAGDGAPSSRAQRKPRGGL
jgi:hypothetical protein